MPPASAAPRLPASMIPGPPPVQTTPSRLPVASARIGAEPGELPRLLVVAAEPRQPGRRAPARSAGSGMRALPNITTVEAMPRSASAISVFRSSSCRRTGRSSSRVRKSASLKARR